MWFLYEIFWQKSSKLKTDRPPSFPSSFCALWAFPYTHTHSPSVVFYVHISIWWSSFLSETVDPFRYVSFLLAAYLLPKHPPSFSKMFLFRETIAPWDIARQAGRQTEQVSPPSLSVADFILAWVKFLATHHHSTCQCRLGNEEASGCVCSLLSLLRFLAVCRTLLFRYQNGVYLPDISDGSPKKRKLIAIITGSVAWNSGKWYAYFKRDMCSLCHVFLLVNFTTLLFMKLHIVFIQES